MVTNTKAPLRAPCVYLTKDANGEPKTGYPDVNCSKNCDSCGWNPKEAQRRFKTGRWAEIGVRLNVDTGEIVKTPAGTRALFFKGVKHESV